MLLSGIEEVVPGCNLYLDIHLPIHTQFDELCFPQYQDSELNQERIFAYEQSQYDWSQVVKFDMLDTPYQPQR